MLLEGPKMQLYCADVSPGKGAAEAARRAPSEEIAEGGSGQALHPADGVAAVESGETGGFGQTVDLSALDGVCFSG